MRNASSSIERSVSIAAWTIAVIDCGSIGMCGRNRHSYSWSSPVVELDDRLERDAVELAQAEEVVERLGLDDLASTGAMPIRSARPDSWTAPTAP